MKNDDQQRGGQTGGPAVAPSGAGRGVTAVILAAGRSTRMKTDLPKVMHEVSGRPMLAYVLDACQAAGITNCIVVVGFAKQAILDAFGRSPGPRFVEQTEQKGTGHAVSMCAEALRGLHGDVMVLAGDMPLVRAETLKSLLAGHRATGGAASMATTVLENPAGYGRIVRTAAGEFDCIVEDRDCTAEQLAICEVNPSYYCFDSASLLAALPQIKPNNAKGEYYITDVLAILKKAGKPVRAATSVPAEDAMGINSRADLAEIDAIMQRRIRRGWMEEGVSLVDPDNIWIDSRARIGRETVIRPFSYIEGNARIGAGCRIGPFSYIADGAVIADGSVIGPGVLTALDAAGGGSAMGSLMDKKQSAAAVRRPPAQVSFS